MANLVLRILKRVSIIGLPFIVANLVILTSNTFFDEQREYHETIRGIAQHQEVSVLILGDSHPKTLANEMLNQTTYNMSQGGDGPKEVFVKLSYALGERNIKYLLVTTDAHMFGDRRRISTNQTFIYPYAIRAGVAYVYDTGYLAMRLEPFVPLFNDSYLEFEKKRLSDFLSGEIAKRELNAQLRADESMWANEISSEVRQRMARATGRSDHRGVLEDPEQIEVYRKLFEVAHSAGVTVVGISYPAMPQYHASLPIEKLVEFTRFLESLPFDIRLDYRSFTDSPDLFRNEDHLTSRGAWLLLQQIERDLGMELAAKRWNG